MSQRTLTVLASTTLLLTFVVCIKASEAGNEVALTQLRSLIEESTRKSYLDAVRALKVATDERIAKGIISTPSVRDEKMAEAGVKTIFYNKAYAIYACAKKTRDLENNTDMEECEAKLIAQLNKTLKLTDYIYAVGNKAAIRCEMQSRRYQEEIEFPPFDFLENARLLDHEKFNECILSSMR